MRVQDGMSPSVLSVGPNHTLRQVARLMTERNVGSAVIFDPDGEGPGIITERDILRAVAADRDVDQEMVADHLNRNATVTESGASLEEAAETMVRAGFRHLVVVDGPHVVGVLSMRDVVRCWVGASRPST